MEYFISMERFKIQVNSGSRKINATVISPTEENLAPKPALVMTLGATREYTLYEHPGNKIFIQMLIEAGHRVVSFDLPQHGERVDSLGSEIDGIREAFLAGRSPFAMFVEDAIAVFDHCVKLGLGEDRNLLVSGISRGAYFALRLFAYETRIQAASVFSPVVDWGRLQEFASIRENASVEDLRLSHFTTGMAGRPLFMAVGNHDERVGTDSVCRFYLDLLEANEDQHYSSSLIDFYLTGDHEHNLGIASYTNGAAFLLNQYVPKAQFTTKA